MSIELVVIIITTTITGQIEDVHTSEVIHYINMVFLLKEADMWLELEEEEEHTLVPIYIHHKQTHSMLKLHHKHKQVSQKVNQVSQSSLIHKAGFLH